MSSHSSCRTSHNSSERVACVPTATFAPPEALLFTPPQEIGGEEGVPGGLLVELPQLERIRALLAQGFVQLDAERLCVSFPIALLALHVAGLGIVLRSRRHFLLPFEEFGVGELAAVNSLPALSLYAPGVEIPVADVAQVGIEVHGVAVGFDAALTAGVDDFLARLRRAEREILIPARLLLAAANLLRSHVAHESRRDHCQLLGISVGELAAVDFPTVDIEHLHDTSGHAPTRVGHFSSPCRLGSFAAWGLQEESASAFPHA